MEVYKGELMRKPVVTEPDMENAAENIQPNIKRAQEASKERHAPQGKAEKRKSHDRRHTESTLLSRGALVSRVVFHHPISLIAVRQSNKISTRRVVEATSSASRC